MAVRLRVAGIFFDQEFFNETDNVPFPSPESPATEVNLLQILQEARRITKERFGFIVETRKDLAGNDFKSMVAMSNDLEQDLDPSLGKQKRKAGLYVLTETPIQDGVVAWQYYVYRNGKSVSSAKDKDGNSTQPFSPAAPSDFEPPLKAGFTSLDQMPIQDGDEIIWRMIAIKREPLRADDEYKPREKKKDTDA